MFEDKNTAVRAEKLSHILEALEKLKVTANTRYESAFGQVGFESWLQSIPFNQQKI